MDWGLFGSAISGAIIGGLIAGYFALRATQKSFDNQRIHAEESEAKLIKGVLQSIHDEVETVFDRYQETMGSSLESLGKNEALTFYYPLVSDFFPSITATLFSLAVYPTMICGRKSSERTR